MEKRPRKQRLQRVDHAPLRLTLRLDEREREVYISDIASRTSLSILFYIFYRSLSCHTRSRDFHLASLVLSSLLYSLFFLFLFALPRIPFILSLRVLFLRPSSHLSSRVPLRCSPAPSTPLCVISSSSLFSFSLLSSACLPSSGRTDRSCRAHG